MGYLLGNRILTQNRVNVAGIEDHGAAVNRIVQADAGLKDE